MAKTLAKLRARARKTSRKNAVATRVTDIERLLRPCLRLRAPLLTAARGVAASITRALAAKC